jgi:hypothetical protein
MTIKLGYINSCIFSIECIAFVLTSVWGQAWPVGTPWCSNAAPNMRPTLRRGESALMREMETQRAAPVFSSKRK